jgi:hypothetical protein
MDHRLFERKQIYWALMNRPISPFPLSLSYRSNITCLVVVSADTFFTLPPWLEPFIGSIQILPATVR